MDDKQLIPQQDPFSTMERMDEQQVLDEIKGRALDALVYEIQQGGKTVTGLSLAGVREVTRLMNVNGRARIGITNMIPLITETDEYFEIKVYAQDAQNGGGYWGVKRQPKQYANGNANPFALEQALAKAQRNALRGLIPEYFAKEMIDSFRVQGKMQTVTDKRNVPNPQRDVLQKLREEIKARGGKVDVLKTTDIDTEDKLAEQIEKHKILLAEFTEKA